MARTLALSKRYSRWMHKKDLKARYIVRARYWAVCCALLLLLLLSIWVWTESAEILVGRVVGVSDGDTITVLDAQRVQHKVRLAGIDAPEKSQPFGNSAKESLSDLVFGKTVTVEHSRVDRFGRVVGKVLVGDVEANLAQVRAGMAWHYKEYEREQSVVARVKYAYAENVARQRRIGLWRDTNPTPPWDFRRVQREGSKVPAPKSVTAQSASNSQCDCISGTLCTGERGGQYCVRPNGKRQYQQ